MIEKSQSLSMSESMEYLNGEEDSEMKGFMNKFVKLSVEDARKLRKEIEEMDLLKVRASHISKIINLMPQSKEELNKIFTDVSLEEDEITKILDTIKKYN